MPTLQRFALRKSRTISFFLTRLDESSLSASIRETFPATVFIDLHEWHDVAIPARPSIADCLGPTIYIWNPDLLPTLPASRFGEGWNVTDGMNLPTFSRSLLRGEDLTLGQLRMSYSSDHVESKRFAETLARIVRKQAAGPVSAVRRYTGELVRAGVKSFVVGKDAYRRAEAGLVLTYADVQYLPEN